LVFGITTKLMESYIYTKESQKCKQAEHILSSTRKDPNKINKPNHQIRVGFRFVAGTGFPPLGGQANLCPPAGGYEPSSLRKRILAIDYSILVLSDTLIRIIEDKIFILNISWN
jgi:hypothetical protein